MCKIHDRRHDEYEYLEEISDGWVKLINAREPHELDADGNKEFYSDTELGRVVLEKAKAYQKDYQQRLGGESSN